ncbi:MAG: hypothetical protein IT168_33330 [Bryobacterales bacterium]|nr:hypothetical protein [Bryobacterales bacterium]
MATEAIYKLQPHRTMHLRGFDRRGAAAAFCETSDSGFKVYGTFRDMADFAVLMLYDADNTFEHYSMRYLPDTDFSGMVLTFDVHYDGLQPIDSIKWNWIDWATLDVIRPNGTTGSVRLFDHATMVSGSHTKASTSFVLGSSLSPWTHVTLWYENIAFDWWGDGSHTPSVSEILNSLADQINNYDWTGIDMPISATVNGALSRLVVEAIRAGDDGNHIRLYARTNGVMFVDPDNAGWFVGGSSDVTWRVSIDFSALGIDSIRQCWLTFAPKLPYGEAYADTEWSATFSNWTVADPNGKRALKVAGRGSVRVGSRDAWVSYSEGGSWVEEASNQPGGTGWFYHGFARRAHIGGDKVTIRYACQSTHDIYLGTSLYRDRGIVSVRLDGDSATDLDCFLAVDSPLVTRRKIRQNVGAGEHTIEITLTGAKHVKQGLWDSDSLGTYFYFDYLEAAVLSDVPDPVQTYANVSPAIDYDTDHTYKLSPQRLIWNLDKLGFRGTLNEYVGVFWWNQRRRVGGQFPSVTVTFSTSGWGYGGAVWLQFGGQYQNDANGTKLGKTYFPTDEPWVIAQHFCNFINETMVGVWASLDGATLTITSHSPTYDFNFWAWTDSTGGSVGSLTVTGDLHSADEGEWQIDDSVENPINFPTRKWHSDLFGQIAAKGWGAVVSFSLELVNPPEAPDSVWAARFWNGVEVETDVGFNSLKSTHCTFSPKVTAFLKTVYREMAGLMNAAGLTPWLQFGENTWWFFDWYQDPDTGLKVPATMAFYDEKTKEAAQMALGRPLARFDYVTDDPAVNGFTDANFLRSRIKAHHDAIRTFVQATYPNAKFELLFPYDTNYPSQNGYGIGGRLNRYVNLPSEYGTKTGSGLDRLKMEALSFGAQERNADKAREAITFPCTVLSWPKADTAYLVPIFNGGCPWHREYLAAVNGGVPLINLWAFDHICLMSWPVPLPTNTSHVAVF